MLHIVWETDASTLLCDHATEKFICRLALADSKFALKLNIPLGSIEEDRPAGTDGTEAVWSILDIGWIVYRDPE